MVLLGAVAIGYLGLLSLLYWNQNALIFHPSQRSSAPPVLPGLVAEELALRDTPEGNGSFHAWHYQRLGAKKIIVFMGGNGSCMADSADRMAWLGSHFAGSIFTFDYPGYGRCSGTPSQASLTRLLERWVAHISGPLGYRVADITFWGHSLGAGVAAQVAELDHLGGLVLEGAFTSVAERAQEIYPFFPAQWLCRHPFEVRGRLSATSTLKILIAHSPADEVVPYSHGRALAAALPRARVRFAELQGGHNEAYRAGEASLLSALREFQPGDWREGNAAQNKQPE